VILIFVLSSVYSIRRDAEVLVSVPAELLATNSGFVELVAVWRTMKRVI